MNDVPPEAGSQGSTSEATAPTAKAPKPPRTPRQHVLRVLMWITIVVFAWFALDRLIGRIDWSAVGSAVAQVEPWMVLPLIVVLLVRQGFNAIPLACYVPGLRWFRSLQNDLVANVVATFAPPPGDIVLRVAMFRSWGVDPIVGMTGSTLNSFTFYAVRFLMPGLGLLLLLGYQLERRQYVLAGLCLLVAAAIISVLVALLSSDKLAYRIGTWVGQLVRVVRRSTDPGKYAMRTVELRHQASDNLRRGLVPSILGLMAMVLADAGILLLALRAVGVGADALSPLLVIGAVFLVYPLTTLPLFGFGVLDAVLVGAWTTVAGAMFEPTIVAGTVVWRLVTIVGTLVLGGITLVIWRATVGRAAREPLAEA